MESDLEMDGQFDTAKEFDEDRQIRESKGSSEELSLGFRLFLCRERSFYGPGTHRLLQMTEETGSLLEACRRMGLSYSKGRKIIALTEQQLGYAVIESKQGGKAGGYSVVTLAGKALLDNYAAFCLDAQQTLEQVFRKYFCSDEEPG